MRPILISMTSILALAGCQGILDIPSEGQIGCPEPCMVTVSGRTVRAESLGAPQQALGNVTVQLASVNPPQEVMTDASGAYSFAGLVPGTPIAFNLSVPQTDPDVKGLLSTRYFAGTTERDDIKVLDLPVVPYRWLAKVAFECGIFASLTEALGEPGTVNPYFTTRATIIGQVLKANGAPARLDRGDISVVINGFRNYHQNPLDLEAKFCFLEPDEAAGEYKGVSADLKERTTSGRFVLFHARNDTGTGSGMGAVQIPGFPPGALSVSSGSIGFVRIQLGVGDALPDRTRTFERDVYYYFAEETCSLVCHRPPNGVGGSSDGIAYLMAPVRLGPGGLTYRADWSASVDQVFDNLTKPFDTNCAMGGDTAARVCLAMPTASLLYRKPGGLLFHEGVFLGTEHDMVVTILKWIEDGAILR
jgi:hypothetical protein